MDLHHISICILHVFLGFVKSETNLKISCVRDEYYSESTNKCLPCPTHCTTSETKGVAPICPTSCIECPLHQYRDKMTGACKRCDELCHQAEVRGTENLCQELCPVERPQHLNHEETNTPITEALAKTVTPPRSASNYLTTTTQPTSTTQQLSTISHQTTLAPSTLIPVVRHLHWSEIVVIALAVTVVMVSALGVVWIYKHIFWGVVMKILKRCTSNEGGEGRKEMEERLRFPVQVDEREHGGDNETVVDIEPSAVDGPVSRETSHVSDTSLRDSS